MKIRTDFVTNSSSTSFVVWGVCKDNITLSDEVLVEAFDKYIEQHRRYIKYEEMANMDDIDKVKWMKEGHEDYMFDYLYRSDIIEIGGQYDNEVGIHPETLMQKFPNEPLGNSKKIVANELNKKFGTKFTDKDIYFFESGWYDG